MSLHYFDIVRCQKDIASLYSARAHCSKLRANNTSLSSQLSSLSTTYTTEIKLEDVAGFMAKLRNIPAQNDTHISAIEQAIDARIARLNSDIARYRELDRREAARRAEERSRAE